MAGQNCKNSRVAGAISPTTFRNHEQNQAKFHPRGVRPEDRYSIVQEAIRDGHAETCRKYHLSPSLLRKWRLKYLSKGKEGLKDSYARVDPQLRALEEENERLKRIVAKQALELEPRWRTTQERTAKKNSYSIQEKLDLMKQFEAKVSRTLLCQWLDLPRSVYYYQPQPGRPGARPSQMTMKLDGSWVDNQQVVLSIRQLLNVEFNALGYEYITYELKKEYLINKKKVYRLMKEHNLLLGKVIQPTIGKREFVKFKRIEATKPLEYL